MSQTLGMTAYFVYGTLKPDGLYWGRVSSLVSYWEPSKVKGSLYDTGLGYPAALFEGDDEIEGMLLYVAIPNAAQVTAIMDEIEEEGLEYRRREVVTLEGVRAWAYEWALDTEQLRPIDGF